MIVRSHATTAIQGSGDGDARSVAATMTLEEQASLLTGATAWTTAAVDRLGVRSLVLADGPHGVRRVRSDDSMDIAAIPATCFPTASALASSWDAGLLRAVGEAIGEEAQALEVDVVLGPGVNIKRSPLCGRNFEYFSEDPFLAGELAIGHIEGVQSRGVGTSLKHFAANNQESRRMTVDAQIDERTLREIYLPAFEAAVTCARPWTVMCSYNRVNGTLASQNRRLLTEILRDEWGFDGVVISDWGAVRNRPAAVAAGLDLEMPGPRDHRVRAVVDAANEGRIPRSAVEDAAARVIALGLRAADRLVTNGFDADGHHVLARQAAADGMVLLKNNGLLPLRGVSRLAVIGRGARHPHIQGGGSSQITPSRVDEPLMEIIRLAGDASITYADGYPEGPEDRPDLIADAAATAGAADVAILFAMLPSWKEVEGADRVDLDLPEQQVALIRAVATAQPRTVVVLNNGSAVTMADWIDAVPAVLEAWMMGQAGGGAVAEVLYGRVNPSGKLAETFPLRLVDTPAYLNFPGDYDTVRYSEGLFVGYRWYDARDLDVLFPFGFGLSYSSFEYRDVRASGATIEPGGSVSVSVDITNTSGFAGREIVQVYVAERTPRVRRPPKELKGFAKVAVEPGQTLAVSIKLGPRAFQHYDPVIARWVADAGEYDILVGASSRDIRGRATVTLVAGDDRASTLTHDSTLGDWLEDPRGREPAEALVARLIPSLIRAFGPASDDPEALSPMGVTVLGSLPLVSAVEFASDPESPSGDDVVNALLAALAVPDAGPANPTNPAAAPRR